MSKKQSKFDKFLMSLNDRNFNIMMKVINIFSYFYEKVLIISVKHKSNFINKEYYENWFRKFPNLTYLIEQKQYKLEKVLDNEKYNELFCNSKTQSKYMKGIIND